MPTLDESSVMLLTYAFRLMEIGATATKSEDVEDLIASTFGDGTNLGQYIVMATLLLGLMLGPYESCFL